MLGRRGMHGGWARFYECPRPKYRRKQDLDQQPVHRPLTWSSTRTKNKSRWFTLAKRARGRTTCDAKQVDQNRPTAISSNWTRAAGVAQRAPTRHVVESGRTLLAVRVFGSVGRIGAGTQVLYGLGGVGVGCKPTASTYDILRTPQRTCCGTRVQA